LAENFEIFKNQPSTLIKPSIEFKITLWPPASIIVLRIYFVTGFTGQRIISRRTTVAKEQTQIASIQRKVKNS
jgi:hypothetical protein